MIWICPRCHGRFTEDPSALTCTECGASYPVIGTVPDLRVAGESWIDVEADRAQARALAGREGSLTLEQVVRTVFASRPDWDEERVTWRTLQVLQAPDRLASDVSGWLKPLVRDGSALPFLDLGCGPGMLLAAAARAGASGVGVDVSLTWLIVARRLIRELGGTPYLAAAFAEELPLPSESVSSVVSLDVIEHVANPVPYLREIDRVTQPGGGIALSTPNRFSLGAEPHVNVWGVGWVPRRWQKQFAEWRTGEPYEYTRLLSGRELLRLVRAHTRFTCRIQLPAVPTEEISRFPAWRAFLARAYNRLRLHPPFRWVLHAVGPFFHIVGRKPVSVSAAAAAQSTHLQPVPST